MTSPALGDQPFASDQTMNSVLTWVQSGKYLLCQVTLCQPVSGCFVYSIKYYPGGRKTELILSISEILSQMCYHCIQYTKRQLMNLVSFCYHHLPQCWLFRIYYLFLRWPALHLSNLFIIPQQASSGMNNMPKYGNWCTKL